MHSFSSSNFFLRPWLPSAPFYSKRARYSVHLSESSMRDISKRSIFSTDETKKVVWTCLRLETGSNIYYIWSFAMHSISSSNFLLRSWCNFTPFYLKRARFSVHLTDTSMGYILKRSNFFLDETKKSGFNLSTLRNKLPHLSILKFHHAIKIFIKLLSAALVHFTTFYSKRARYSVHLSESSMRDISKRSIFSTDETKKVVLSCLRLQTGSKIYCFWSFTMHSISSSIFFLRPWCNFAPFYSKRARYSVHLNDTSMGDRLKRNIFFSQMRPKKCFQPVYA